MGPIVMSSRPRRTFLFGDRRIAAATSGAGGFEHTFGGPPDRTGAAREDCGGLLLHLLHRFDLTDPAVPIEVPGLRWLPIYYCFDFRANEVRYKLLSDDAMAASFPGDDPNVTAKEEWPDEDYPAAFPRSDVVVAPFPYDPTDLEDAYNWGGVLGIDGLSEADRAAVRTRQIEVADVLGVFPPETDEEFEEDLTLPFMQGKPPSACVNPDCADHGRKGAMRVIALLPAEPVSGVSTFGSMGSNVKLIVQMCRRCHVIRTSNESG